jgi:hypothetical protein
MMIIIFWEMTPCGSLYNTPTSHSIFPHIQNIRFVKDLVAACFEVLSQKFLRQKNYGEISPGYPTSGSRIETGLVHI